VDATMPPKRKNGLQGLTFSSSSDSDEGPDVPQPGRSGLSKTPTKQRKVTVAPTRNKPLWNYFDLQENFIPDPKDPKARAKV